MIPSRKYLKSDSKSNYDNKDNKSIDSEPRDTKMGCKRIDVGNALYNKILNSKYEIGNGIKKMNNKKDCHEKPIQHLEHDGCFDAKLHKNESQFDPKFRAMLRQIARDTVRRKILEIRNKQDAGRETTSCDPDFTKLLDAIHATELQDVKIHNFVNSVQNVIDKLNDLNQLRGTYDSLMKKLSAQKIIDENGIIIVNDDPENESED